MSTIIEKQVAVRVTELIESLHTLRKKPEIAEVSVVTPKQSKSIKPVNTAILSKTPEIHPDPTTYLIQLLKTSKPVQKGNRVWFPTPESPGQTEDHTAIQTCILKKFHELKN